MKFSPSPDSIVLWNPLVKWRPEMKKGGH